LRHDRSPSGIECIGNELGICPRPAYAQTVKPGRNNRPAAARKALRRDKPAVFIAVASQVNQPEIMITAGAGDNAAVTPPRSGRPANRGAVLADNAIVGDAARRRILLCLNKPVFGLGYRGIDAIGLAIPMIDRLCRLLPA
jgi:hypothetical protein